MARVAGKDVMLELMNTVERLEKTAGEHADTLAELAETALKMSAGWAAIDARLSHMVARSNKLEQTVATIHNTVATLQKDVAGHTRDLSFLSKSLSVMAEDSANLTRGFATGAAQTREQQRMYGQLARTVTGLAGESDARFDELEHRVTKLEKKSA